MPQANRLYQSGHWEAALELYAKALAHHVDDAILWNQAELTREMAAREMERRKPPPPPDPPPSRFESGGMAVDKAVTSLWDHAKDESWSGCAHATFDAIIAGVGATPGERKALLGLVPERPNPDKPGESTRFAEDYGGLLEDHLRIHQGRHQEDPRRRYLKNPPGRRRGRVQT